MANTSPLTAENIDAMQAGPALDKMVEILTDRWFGWEGSPGDTDAVPYSTDREAINMLAAALLTTDPWLTIHGPFYVGEAGEARAIGGWFSEKGQRSTHIPLDQVIVGEGDTYAHAACKLIVKAMVFAVGDSDVREVA